MFCFGGFYIFLKFMAKNTQKKTTTTEYLSLSLSLSLSHSLSHQLVRRDHHGHEGRRRRLAALRRRHQVDRAPAAAEAPGDDGADDEVFSIFYTFLPKKANLMRYEVSEILCKQLCSSSFFSTFFSSLSTTNLATVPYQEGTTT